MCSSDDMLKRLLELSAEERAAWLALTPGEKRIQALRSLMQTGIVDADGNLTEPYRDQEE